MAWQDVRSLYQEQDDPGPGPKWPEVGGVYEITVAVGYDGRAIVIEAPEEFRTIADEEDGSAYFARDGLTDSLEPGIHKVLVRFEFQEGRGEAGSYDPGGNDWWFSMIDPAVCEGKEHRWTSPRTKPGVVYCSACGVDKPMETTD